jgi:phenylacetate-CoA ligase
MRTDRAPRPQDLDPIERASRDEIASLQLERLRRSLRHAYDGLPRYRAACEARGLHPDDLRRLEDLRLFPFTTKEDLRQGYPFGSFAVPRERIVRVHASSGTTGKPTVVGYTRADLEVWSEVVARSIRAAGGRPGDLIHVVYGYGLFTGGLGLHYGAERLGLTVVPMSGGMTERQAQLIRDFGPQLIAVTPSYLLAIADELDLQGGSASTTLEVGILGAEPWTETMRAEIERRFDMHAVDIYGLSEIIGPGVACECVETKDGLHLWEDHFYPEIVNPETGHLLPDGKRGELVLTTLTREASPVVRYRTRDLTRLLPGTARTMRRIERITGRSDDMLIVRGCNLFPSQVEELLSEDERLTLHYVLELRRDGPLDELTVAVEARPASADPEASEVAATALARHLKERLGLTARVLVREPGTIERSAGKARRVLDLRGAR